MGDAAPRDGLRLRHVVLAQAPGLARARCLGGPAPGAAGTAARGGGDRLAPGLPRQRERAREKGGALTGPNPTDRGRPGTKHYLLVDRDGIPLAVFISPANWHDSPMLEPLLDAVRPVKGLWGRPRKRPDKLHGDKGYDSDRCRDACRKRGITPRIARRGVESSEKLG